MIVKTDELANMLGITARRVQELANEEVFEKEARGEWDAPKCIARYVDYKLNQSTQGYGLTEARAKKELADAQLKELALAEKKGEVISLDKLAKDLADIAATLSNRLYNLPHALKRKTKISDECESALSELIDELLAELKNAKIYTDTKKLEDKRAKQVAKEKSAEI